jgi:hypothetical protein
LGYAFAWFGTTGSKNRGNFLDLLRAGHADYVISDLQTGSPGLLAAANFTGAAAWTKAQGHQKVTTC